MKIRTILPRVERWDSERPKEGVYTVLAVDIYHDPDSKLLLKGKVVYVIWDGQLYETYNSEYFEIIDSRISQFWEFKIDPLGLCNIGIKHWIQNKDFQVNVLYEGGPDRLLFQKYRKMMEQEFDDNLDKESDEYIDYASIPDEEYVWQPEPPIIPPPIGKSFD